MLNELEPEINPKRSAPTCPRLPPAGRWQGTLFIHWEEDGFAAFVSALHPDRLHRILQRRDPGLVELAPGQPQLRAIAGGQERHAPAEEHRHDGYIDLVHQPRVEQRSEQDSATEQPDVLAAPRAEFA